MPHGPSGTAWLGPSGTRRSDFREPERAASLCDASQFRPRNYANKESFGFLLTQGGVPSGRAAPALPLASAVSLDRLSLTEVTLVWRRDQHEDWFKFGRPLAERIVDRHRRIETYGAGHVFALVRWASNDYGTERSTLDIVRAVTAGEPCTSVAQVDPGGELLLSVHGWTRVAQAFRLIDAIAASGIDPCEVAPDHWRHLHNRLAGGARPRAYCLRRHRAWLTRKALLP